MMRLLVLTILAALLVFGCAGQQPANNSSPPPASGKVVEVSMTAKQFEFNPSTITVKKGDTVKLTVTSEDATHGFSLPDFGVSLTLSPGVPATATFVADKSGEFTFACNQFCGSGHTGMKGTLVVTE